MLLKTISKKKNQGMNILILNLIGHKFTKQVDAIGINYFYIQKYFIPFLFLFINFIKSLLQGVLNEIQKPKFNWLTKVEEIRSKLTTENIKNEIS